MAWFARGQSGNGGPVTRMHSHELRVALEYCEPTTPLVVAGEGGCGPGTNGEMRDEKSGAR